jgi:flagellar assembly protein FliH
MQRGTRMLRGVETGEAIGTDEMGRYLSPDLRERLLAQLRAEVEVRTQIVLAEARSIAAAIVAEAEQEAVAIRARAAAEGHAEGYATGHAAGIAAVEPVARLLRDAADSGAAIRAALLDGVEQHALEVVRTALRRMVGMAAEGMSGVAASVVREGLRMGGPRAVRVRVHPDDVAAVTVAVQAEGQDVPVFTDDAVSLGGCIIDVEGGTIDLRLDGQLERTLAALDQG